MNREVSQRRKTEQELAKSREQLQAILDHSPALIYAKDLEGRYNMVTAHGCEEAVENAAKPFQAIATAVAKYDFDGALEALPALENGIDRPDRLGV